jgi:hypothetical protein
MKETYTIEEIAKFYTLTTASMAILITEGKIAIEDMRVFYVNLLADLRTGAIERCVAEFDKQMQINKN